ncbi:MAG TPA: hypothetical protein VJO13_03065, partial [Ktedonobacterales bacterium]|nr:hypothetical protein [Ktedonobacterales bacterium]
RLFSEVYPEDSLERDLQVGDCYSLLGRTYLVGHDMGESRASIDRAYSLLQEGFNKPYVDLLLLDAEWQLKEHALSLSLAKYQETLELLGTHSASDTEMCARAHMGMGYYWKARLQLVAKKSRAYEKEQSFALTAFERAAEVYRGKDEQAHQARAEWEAALVREQFPQVLLIYLEKLRFPVRVAVIDEYHEYLQSRPGQGHRHPANPAITYRGKSSPEEPTEKQIREWISRAKEKVEMDERRW